MKDCIREAYVYYHNPLSKECESEISNLPILFGRKKKEEALREKYMKKGLKVITYEDIKSSRLPEFSEESRYGYKGCATFTGYDFVCGIDGSSVKGCECCKTHNDCQKLQKFLWADLYD